MWEDRTDFGGGARWSWSRTFFDAFREETQFHQDLEASFPFPASLLFEDGAEVWGLLQTYFYHDPPEGESGPAGNFINTGGRAIDETTKEEINRRRKQYGLSFGQVLDQAIAQSKQNYPNWTQKRSIRK